MSDTNDRNTIDAKTESTASAAYVKAWNETYEINLTHQDRFYGGDGMAARDAASNAAEEAYAKVIAEAKSLK